MNKPFTDIVQEQKQKFPTTIFDIATSG